MYFTNRDVSQICRQFQLPLYPKMLISIGSKCTCWTVYSAPILQVPVQGGLVSIACFPSVRDAGTLTDNKQLHHRGCGKAMHHGSNGLVTLPSFFFSSIFPFHLLFTHPAISIAHVVPIICICQRTPLAFEGLLRLTCKTIKKKKITGNQCLARRAVQRKDQSFVICILSVCEAGSKCYKVTLYSTAKGALLALKKYKRLH